jgi:uncharacterized protein (TIGR03437 family)
MSVTMAPTTTMTTGRRSLFITILTISAAIYGNAESFVAPVSGTLYLQCVGGSAGAISQFGTGNSIGSFVSYLNSLPGSCPTSEVQVGAVAAGQTVTFGIHTLWNGKDYWAFSNGTDQGSVVSFTDMNNSLGMGGKIIQQTGTNSWVMHLNDAAHYTLSTDEANNILIQLRLASSGPPPPQIGGGTCSTSMVNGTYFYLSNGVATSNGSIVPFAELTKLVADGLGGVSGQSYGSLNGQQATNSFTGTYSIQPSCAGTITVAANSQPTTTLTFQVVNNGQGMVIAVSGAGAVVTGTAYRQTAGTTPIQCGNGSLSGGYGYLLVGIAPVSGGVAYADAGQFVTDGNGNGNVASVANFGGSTSQVTGTGSYTVSSDCSGTASVTNQNGTIHYRFAIVRDGQVVYFFGTDPGWTVAGVFTPQFAPPQQAIVNGASFQSQMVSPGSLFSIFGTGLSTQTASASKLPLPRNLGGAQVVVNGELAPLVYVSGHQINAQMPIDIPTGQPVSLTITNGGATSNVVTITVPRAAPGIFTLNGSQAIVQNQNGSINSTGAPARPGDVLVAYLTGGGAVNAAGAWITGAGSPSGPASVSAPYTVAVGGTPAAVEYLGLTPGFVGLYQANFTVPAMTPGSYPVVVTVGGVSSNAASIAIGE